MSKPYLSLIIVAAAACGNDATRVHLDVSSGPVVDYYEVRVGDHTALADPLPTLELLVPDEMGGQTTAVQVWGLAAGQQIAYGTTTVTPKTHGVVDGAVALSAVVCGDWCQEGTVACDHDGTTTCTLQDNGCMGWSDTTPCPSSAPFCSNGTCQAVCSDECSTAQTECDSAVSMRSCGQFDSDSCLDWGPSTACASGQSCQNGACTGTQTCEDGNKCDDGDACTINDSCSGSVCSGDPKCTTAPANADPTCSAGTCDFTCHDGFIKQGTMCVPRPALIFVSSTFSTGKLGGLGGADAKCQTLATAAGKHGTFKAYLADTVTSVDARFVHSTRSYALVDGTVVAQDYIELTSGLVQHEIDLDESGTFVDDAYVWTGQSEGGLGTSGFECTKWTSSSAAVQGEMLSTGQVDFTDIHIKLCDLSDDTEFPDDGRLFCVEQLP